MISMTIASLNTVQIRTCGKTLVSLKRLEITFQHTLVGFTVELDVVDLSKR